MSGQALLPPKPVDRPLSSTIPKPAAPAPANDLMMTLLPSTSKIYRFTKRELFARRMSHMDRPLIILNFQGVIGDFVSEKGQSEGFNLRTGAMEGLKYLAHHF